MVLVFYCRIQPNILTINVKKKDKCIISEEIKALIQDHNKE